MPKELISRFVKLCPTCQVRRGTARNSPPESERSPETRINSHSSEEMLSRSTVVNNSTVPFLSVELPGSATFQQQNRWITPLSPQQATLGSSNTKHEVYDTMLSAPITYADNAPTGMSFSFVNTSFSSVAVPSSAYNSTASGHSAHGYGSAWTTEFQPWEER